MQQPRVGSVGLGDMRAGRAPRGWPLLGHGPALLRSPLQLLESLPAHGDLVEIRLGLRRAFVLCHPELAQRVLADFRAFDRAGPMYDRVRLATGNGLPTAAREDHRRLRRIMQPAFRREHLPGYASVMEREIAAMMATWRDGQLVDIVAAISGLTTGVALGALSSAQSSPADVNELWAALDTFLKGVYTRAIVPLGFLIPGSRRYARAMATWRAQAGRMISESRRPAADGDDLMSRIVAASDGEGEGMSDAELIDQAAPLLQAAGRTTASTVTWALHLLSAHPEVLAALHAETDAVLGTRPATWADLPRLELTARVVHESLRLYPPIWVVPRTAVRDTTLAGRAIPAGSLLVVSPYLLHRRPDQFPDPARFDPDRWLMAATAAHRGAFIPFGVGAARCIGEDFGLAEAVLILASVTARWTFTPKTGATLSPRAWAVLAPRRFPVYLSARTVPPVPPGPGEMLGIHAACGISPSGTANEP